MHLMAKYKVLPYYSRVLYALVKLAIYYCILHFGYILVLGLSSHFLPLMSVVVGNIFEKWLQDLISFGNPCILLYWTVEQNPSEKGNYI